MRTGRPSTFIRTPMWRFIASVVVLPLVLGGCGPAMSLYMQEVQRAHPGAKQPPPRPDPLADRPVAVAGPVAVTPGPQSALAPGDARYLRDGLATYMRRRFPQAVIAESSSMRTMTVLEVTTTRDTSDAHPAVVQAVVRVYNRNQSLQSVISSPKIAVDLKQADRSEAMDELLAGLTAKLDTLLRHERTLH